MGHPVIGRELSSLLMGWANQGDVVAHRLVRAVDYRQGTDFTHDGEATYVEIEADGLSFLPGRVNPGVVDPWCHPKRQTGRPGKVARKLLTKDGMAGIGDPEIEAFADRVNAHRQGVTGTFTLRRGKDVAITYRRPDGPDSCMKGKPVGWFALYTKNPDSCGILTLEDETGVLIARAMVWETTERGTFMDTPYSTKGGAVRALYAEAQRRDWCYRTVSGLRLPNATIEPDIAMTVPLAVAEFPRYPYVDTVRYLDIEGKRLSSVSGPSFLYTLRSQEGGRWHAE